MLRKSLLIVAILLIAAPAFAANNNDGLMSYEQFLQVRGLNGNDVVERNCVTEDVLNTRSREWDSARRVCELWIDEKTIPEECTPEQVTPAQALKYRDGSQVYRTTREWSEEVMKPDTQPRSGLFMVKQDETQEPQPPEVTAFKRYVTNGK